jgi:hypothetical protein
MFHYSADDPQMALRRFNKALGGALSVSKDDLKRMLAEKQCLMEEKRLAEGKKRRGPKPRTASSVG